MNPGMMPILAFPGEIIPGQLGPMRRVERFYRTWFTLIMSIVGIPSVMQMIKLIPASAASIIAFPAKAGGTKITDVFATVSFLAYCTELKTGTHKEVCPPFPGVTPPTKLVP